MDLPETRVNVCSGCENEIPVENNFCRYCGKAQNLEVIQFHSDKKNSLKQIALFFAIELIFCVSNLLIEEHTLAISLFFDFAMALTTIVFFAFSWKENSYLLKWRSFSFKKIVLLSITTISASIVVNYLVGHLNQLLFEENYTFIYNYIFHEYGNYIMIVSVAVFPAIFEELAYRGFLMQKLLNIVDEKEAIYITSILFFFIHFSMISFFWMLPFSLLLAYVRIREKTLWYGIIIHFLFNLTACLIQIYTYGSFS